MDHGAVVVSAAFGPIAEGFLLDLSAPGSALHDTIAQAHDFTQPTARASLRVGGVSLGEVEMPVADLDARTRPFDSVVAGALGWDVWRRFDLDLDLRGGECRLRLWRRASPADPALVSLRAEASDGLIVRSGAFRLDPTRSQTRVAGSMLSRQDPSGETPVRLRALVVDGALVEQAPAALAPAPPDGAAGVIGSAALSGGRLRIRGGRASWRPVSVPRRQNAPNQPSWPAAVPAIQGRTGRAE
ncbi:MAG TPA: hypothetical protein VG248_11880 [Caulobacteraceae bacterium]|jgi:hypothetical protein|nr:hypothetical protein [Caulobacteraceae bacterium]